MLFSKVAGFFEKIEKASSRLEMTARLSELFREVPAKEIDRVIYLSQGGVGPKHTRKEIGMGEKLVLEAMAKASGFTRKELDSKFKETGDLGEVAREIAGQKKQKSLFSQELSIEKVFANLEKISRAEGHGSQETKLRLMAELLNSASPIEAKFIARIPIDSLRLGIGDPTLMDAFAVNFLREGKKDKKLVEEIKKRLQERKVKVTEEEVEKQLKFKLRERIEEKYNVYSDLGRIAKLLKEKGLKGLREISIEVGTPIRPTLAERLNSVEEIIKKIGKCEVEAKYDGFRFQVHKNGNQVTIFSRQSENMTSMFPEIVEGVRKQIRARKAIFEGEALAVNEETGEFFPFQVTIQRKRKYEVKEKAKEFPLKLFVFDLMFVDGKNLMELPFRERRKELERIVGKGEVIELTKGIVTDDPEKMNSFFEECIERGLEGIIAKDLNAKYIAGARKFAWIKLKRSYKGELQDTVDVAIIGYFKGKGKRARFGLGALLSAVYDDEKDRFKSVAKIGTGITEKKLVELEKMLSKSRVEKKPARVLSGPAPDYWVEPKYVIEVRADEITRSPMHEAGKIRGEGLALRFPRMIKLRADRKPEEATTEKEIIKMFKSQKHTKTGE